MDIQFNVEKGIIVAGKAFSDCLYPPFIDRLNVELASGNIAYDLNGIKDMCTRVLEHFTDGEDVMQQQVRSVYIKELEDWLLANI